MLRCGRNHFRCKLSYKYYITNINCGKASRARWPQGHPDPGVACARARPFGAVVSDYATSQDFAGNLPHSAIKCSCAGSEQWRENTVTGLLSSLCRGRAERRACLRKRAAEKVRGPLNHLVFYGVASQTGCRNVVLSYVEPGRRRGCHRQ
jgi:hypothetical protein